MSKVKDKTEIVHPYEAFRQRLHEEIQQGSIITHERLKDLWEACGRKEEFGLFVLKISNEVERAIRAKGTPMAVVCQVKRDLKVLLPHEANRYRRAKVDRYARGICEEAEGLKAIDPGDLEMEDRKSLEVNIQVAGRYVEALEGARARMKVDGLLCREQASLIGREGQG